MTANLPVVDAKKDPRRSYSYAVNMTASQQWKICSIFTGSYRTATSSW